MNDSILRPRLFVITDPAAVQQLGDMLYLDTCAVLDLLGDSERVVDPQNKTELTRFTSSAVADSVVLCTSIKVAEELRIVLTARLLGGKDKRKRRLSQDPNAMRTVCAEVKKIETAIRNNPNWYEIEYTSDRQYVDAVDRLMENYGVELGDASHYTISSGEGVRDILTSDGDYMQIADPGLRVFTTSANYQRLVRKYRLSSQSFEVTS